ncbi:MAG: hypothetical protein GTO63_10925, partial [Anaerolineae bacterium]|nr:hypothetical protein [Anaerolineae bacterium]NIN95395.1 hypothetical protein [Anaerolineae bacterium]NIQ78386.1 hypothetical protein [Anaerolineae bacterium]
MANVVFVLFAFAGLNALFRRYQPRWTFSQTELLLLYTVLAISTAVGGSCYGQCLPIVMAYPLWAGQLSVDGVTNPAAVHDWSSFLSYLPSWAVIADYQALRGFWMGNSILYNWAILRAWTVPVLAWSGFVTVLFLLTMCLNVLLRRTWVHAERLTFPIVWLPLEMTRPSGELFRSRLLWVGFAPAFAITFFNGLHLFFPTLPVIQISHRSIQGYFPDPPFNAMANLTVCLHPLMIGLGYLLPQELLFSSWFFHLYWQGLRVLTSVAGFTPAEQQVSFPYVSEQAFGGFLVLGVLAVWGARRALRIAWKRAISTPS